MAGAIIGAVIGGSAFTAGSVFFGTTFLASAFTGASLGNMWDQHEAAKKQQAEMERARQDSLKLGSSNTKQADTPIGLIYGTCRVAGNIVYDSALGNTSGVKDMTWIISLGEGEISAVRDVKLNDKIVSAYPSCSYGVHVGTLAQAADGRYPSENFSNTAFLALTLHASDDLTGTPTVTSIVDGIKVLVWNKTSKTMVRQFSRNPAWVLYDVMTNIRYGAGIDPSRIDLDTFIECADYCDYMIDNGSGTMEPRFVFDAVINEIQDAEQLMASIAASFRAFLVCIEGKYKLRIEKAELPIQSFEEGNSIVQGSMAINRASRIDGNSPNRIIVQYVDPVHWSTDEYTLDDDEDIALRGINDKTLSFIGVVRPTQAARTANYIRDMMNLCPNFMEFKVPFEKIECEPGDVIKVTHSLGGYKDKLARVLTIELDEEFQLKLMCREYNAEVYSDDPNKYQVTSTSSFNGTPLTPPDVNALVAVETGYMTKDGVHISDVNVFWEPMIYPSLKYYEVYYQYEDSDTWILNSFTQGNSNIIRNAKTNKKMRIKVVTTSEWNRKSSGVVTDYLCIVGKDAPPNDVSKMTIVQNGSYLNVTITKNNDPDLSYYELRTGVTWETSTLVGTFTDATYIVTATSEGTKTFWIKAVDNSGNYSDGATKAMVNVINLPAKNIIYSETADLSTWTLNKLMRDPWGVIRSISDEKISDLKVFADMFELLNFSTTGIAYLPIIDLGPNIIDEDCFWTDQWGVLHIKQNETIGSLPSFGEMFGNGPWTNVPIKTLASTFVNIDVASNAGTDITIRQDYQVSVDGLTWGDWTPVSQRQFYGRYVQIRLTCLSMTGKTQVQITGASIAIDVQDVEETIENVGITAGVNAIAFRKKFLTPPSSVALFTADTTGKQATWRITNLTKDGFDVEILDDTGANIAGILVKATIRGY